jgi:hypothetical protein
MTIQLYNDERILREGNANHFRGAEAVGGKLYLTNLRLLFRSHALNVQVHEAFYPLVSILGMRLSNTLGVVANGLTVVLDDGREERFVVNRRNEWMAAINLAKGDKPQASDDSHPQQTSSQSPLPPDQDYARLPAEVAGAATTSLWLEIVFGLFSLLGMGHVFSGRLGLGVALLIGWWVFLILASLMTAATGGLCACIFGPMYIAIPIISGIQASTYIKKTGAKGSWKSLGVVAGAGCVSALVLAVGLAILVAFVLGLPLLAGNLQGR